MTVFIGAIVIAGFIYLSGRINTLEKEVRFLKGSTKVPETTIQPNQPKVSAESNLPYQEQLEKLDEETQRPFVTQDEIPNKADVSSDEGAEFKMGSKFFTIVGAIAVLLGVGFFIRYAFANDLISETARVALGVFAGFISLGLGWFSRKKHQIYGDILSGTGLGLWYLSLFGGYSLYEMFSSSTTFLLMAVVTFVGIFISLKYRSVYLAYFVQIGGFLTPFMSSGFELTGALFTYVALLTLSVMAVTVKENWPHLRIGNFLGSVLIFLMWASNHTSDINFPKNLLLYSTIFFIIFLASVIVNYFVRKNPHTGIAVSIAILSPALYYIANAFTVDEVYSGFLITFTLILGVLYTVLGLWFWGMPGNDEKAKIFSKIFLSIAFVFFAIAVPIHFEEGNWLTIAWMALGLVGVMSSFVAKVPTLRFFGISLFILGLINLFGFNFDLAENSSPWLNTRMLTFIMSSVITALASLVYLREKKKIISSGENITENQKDEFSIILNGLILTSFLLPAIAFSAEIIEFYNNSWLVALWSAFAMLAVIISIEMDEGYSLRFAGLITFILSAVSLIFFEGSVNLLDHTPVTNLRVLLGVTLMISIVLTVIYIYKRKTRLTEYEKTNIPGFLFLLFNGVLFWLISMEIYDFFGKDIAQMKESNPDKVKSLRNMQRAGLSVGWTFYAIGLLLVGIARKIKLARSLSLGLFLIVILKVFLYDTTNLNDLYRFVSFITLGVILLVAGYLYYRFKDRIVQFIKAEE